MGGLYNLYSAKKERTFYYRFTCGKCSKTAPWESYSISEEHSIETKKALSEQEAGRQLDASLSKALEAHIDAIKKNTAKGYYFTNPFLAQYKYDLTIKRCPYCGQNPKVKGSIFSTGAICGTGGLFIGLIIIMALAWMRVITSFTTITTSIIAAIVTATTILGFVIGVVVARNDERNAIGHTKVEYCWYGVPPGV